MRKIITTAITIALTMSTLAGCAQTASDTSVTETTATVTETTIETTEARGSDHEWSFVTINGKNYHVDPTYGMGSGDVLTYLMMTDERRADDGYQTSDTTVANHYKGSHNSDQYVCDDDYFDVLKGKYLDYWDPDKNLIYYVDKDGNRGVFDYSSFE